MGRGFIAGNRDQLLLLPPSVDKWVAQDHVVRFIWDCVSQMDMFAFYSSYGREGKPPYDPAMMLAVLIYAYSEGIRSSRKIEKACAEQLPFRWLTGNVVPDHCAISRFRSRHEELIRKVFVETLRLCHEAGLVNLGKIFLDGTKLKANASLEANRRLEQLEKEVAQMLEEAKQADREEDKQFGPDNRGDGLPKELQSRKDRLERLQAAQERLEKEAEAERREQEEKIRAREAEEASTGQKKRGRKPKDPQEAVDHDRKANVTDPDSRIMKTRQQYVQGYNGQAVVTEDQIIVSVAVTQEENDLHQLEPMIEETRRTIDEAGIDKPIGSMAADTGYWRDDLDVGAMEEEGPELVIATQKDHKQRKACQEQRVPRGRIPQNATARERMERKLLTKKGRETYKMRGRTIEPVFGQIKKNFGFIGFVRRGLSAARSEWALICACFNLKKLFGARVAAIAA
ncbi:MAG: IS1182 family transposase [Syntrophobacteraceae bacterium]|nr:IS1182 family transposase [Syntrophobacteraceae bacterium]